MSKIEFLSDQLTESRNFVNRLVSELPQDLWYEIPEHPVASTKYEALSWCFKHEMWHSAEMEDIKRALGHPIKWI